LASIATTRAIQGNQTGQAAREKNKKKQEKLIVNPAHKAGRNFRPEIVFMPSRFRAGNLVPKDGTIFGKSGSKSGTPFQSQK
jgi:hypothetical protein